VGDHETAALFRAIRADEERHLRYCDAIARKFSATDAEFAADRAHMRAVERRVYGQQTRDFSAHMVREGLLVLSQPWHALFCALLAGASAIGIIAPVPVMGLQGRGPTGTVGIEPMAV
jgi:hypothetical protein